MGGSGSDLVRSQYNNGSGLFIGGDNRGSISYELMDDQTKALLAKTASVAPGLARLLGRALSDGVISSDAVDALTMAAHSINFDVAEALMMAGRHINADVADALMTAGRHINADVAESLTMAGSNINEDVAGSFRRSADKLAEERQALERLLSRTFSIPAALSEERVYVSDPPEYPWTAKLKIFGWGVLGGILLCLPLLYHLIFR